MRRLAWGAALAGSCGFVALCWLFWWACGLLGEAEQSRD